MSILDKEVKAWMPLMDYVEMNYARLVPLGRTSIYCRKFYGPALIGTLYLNVELDRICHVEWWPANKSTAHPGVKMDIPAPEDLESLINLEKDCASGDVFEK